MGRLGQLAVTGRLLDALLLPLHLLPLTWTMLQGPVALHACQSPAAGVVPGGVWQPAQHQPAAALDGGGDAPLGCACRP